jgi:UDP-N-acetyl-D-mannosaminuronic acid dehydrogenase
MEVKKMKVCVCGLGNIGKPTIEHVSKFHNVAGYDIDSNKTKNTKYFSSTDWKELPQADVYLICVNTWWKGIPDMGAVREVAKRIKEKSNEKTLVIVESTVSVGESRNLYDNVFKQNIMLTCCPHRFWALDPKKHGVVQRRVLGAINKSSLKEAKKFYNSLHIPIHVVPNLETAEMCKIYENAHRFVQISFVEELKMLSEKEGLDYNELRKAINSKWNINLLEARDGIGGDCLNKDIHYLIHHFSRAPLLEGAVKADSFYKSMLQNRRDLNEKKA